MLGPGPNRRRCGAWRGGYDCGIKFSLAARCVHARKPAPTNGGMAAWKANAAKRHILGCVDRVWTKVQKSAQIDWMDLIFAPEEFVSLTRIAQSRRRSEEHTSELQS